MSHEKSEKVLMLLSHVALAVIKAEEDGKLSFEDVVLFAPLVLEVGPAIQALSGLGEEIKLLSPADVVALASDVLKSLDKVVSDKMVKIIEQSMVVAVESAKLYSVIKS